MNYLGRFEEAVYLVLRIVTGWLFASHGAQKLFGAFGGHKVTGGTMLAAGLVEFIGGILIAIGLITVIAAIVSSGEMAFAYFMAHAPQGAWPIVNKGELAVVYCFVFLYIAFRGPGLYSLDRLIMRKTHVERPVTS